MNNEEALLISQRRDDIYEWVVSRFKTLMAEERVDDALCFADEYFEWLDPNQLDDEETLFFDANELKALYQELTQGWWHYEVIDTRVHDSV